MSGIYYDTFIFYYTTTSSSCFTQQCWDYSWCSTPGTSVLSVEVMVKSMVNDQSDQWRPGHGWCKHYLMLTIGGGGSQGNMLKHWIVTEQNTGTGAPPPATILTVFDHLNISSKHWDDGVGGGVGGDFVLCWGWIENYLHPFILHNWCRNYSIINLFRSVWPSSDVRPWDVRNKVQCEISL